MVQCMRKILTFTIFANCTFVLIPEANTIEHAQQCYTIIKTEYPELWDRSCMLYEVKSARDRPGLQTTKTVNQCYQLQQALREGTVWYWDQAFTLSSNKNIDQIRDKFYTQLDVYSRVPEGSVGKRNPIMTKTQRMVTTGKIGNNKDDMVDAFELYAVGRILFFSGTQYRKWNGMSDVNT